MPLQSDSAINFKLPRGEFQDRKIAVSPGWAFRAPRGESILREVTFLYKKGEA